MIVVIMTAMMVVVVVVTLFFGYTSAQDICDAFEAKRASQTR